MFNDFQTSDDDFFKEDGPGKPEDDPKKEKKGKTGPKFRYNSDSFLGMTAPQRFLIVFMLMVVTLALGSGVLLVLGKIQPF